MNEDHKNKIEKIIAMNNLTNYSKLKKQHVKGFFKKKCEISVDEFNFVKSELSRKKFIRERNKIVEYKETIQERFINWKIEKFRDLVFLQFPFTNCTSKFVVEIGSKFK